MPHRNPYSAGFSPSRSQDWLLRVGAYGSLVLGLSAIALIWLGALYFTHAERIQTERSALHNAENLSRAFEEQIIRSIRAADQTLLYARDAYARDPQQFDMSLWSRNSEFLTGFNFQVVIVDKNGLMVASNIPGSTPGLDLSDREHFKVHAERQTDELFISKPVFGRVSKKWSIQVTRRITMPDGSFGGVVVVSLDPDYLAQFYKSIDVGEKGTVTLVGADGIVRARGTNGSASIGESLLNSRLFAEHAAAGSYVVKSQLDGIERLFVYRAVRGYPLFVVIGLAQDEIFQAYEQNRRTDIAAAAVLTLWLLGVTFLIWRHQRALAAARDAAEAGTRARSEFLAMMSHEIRTPMNGVVGMSEVLMESGLRPDQLSYAKTLRESAEYLMHIINDVLDFSKLEADRIEIERIEFDLHDLVESSVGVLAATAKDKNLSLSVAISPDVPAWVIGDPGRLRQVLFNLVGNGLKFTQAGGVAVTVSRDPQSSEAGQIRLAFAVSDSGIGIPADGVPLLFREFSQLDSSIARRFGGTGLGLAICKRLIDLMGGSIAVDSEVGKGTTFRFTIDCRLEPSLGAAAKRALSDRTTLPDLMASGRTRPLRILLVEDNKTNLLVATKLLQGLGYSADIACNGVEAVEACTVTAYDVVLMDVMMPEMDGLSAARAVRKLEPPFGRPRIIALTAIAQKQDREMCLAAGMDDFLPKPLTRAALQVKLEHAGGASLVATAASAAPMPAQAPIFEPSSYAELAEALGPEDTALVLESFLTDTPERMAAMSRAAKDANNAIVRREAHAIKSSAASFGFARFAALALALERDAMGLNWPALQAAVGDLKRAFDDIEIIARTKLGFHPAFDQSNAPSGALHA
jgi:signal transduction histidine kinase/CheY-like chemotaxis protein/HPt (histidine-containing phosphotransfer) domain-containing protein